MRWLYFALLLAGLFGIASRPQATGADDAFKLEPGFTLLFNGKDLTGWKTKKGGEALDGKSATPDKRFQAKDGTLIIDAKVKGDVTINSAKEFARDVHIKFEYFPGPGCNNDLYIRGLKFDIKKPDVKNLKEGEWNEFEIVIQGGKVEFKSNGEAQRPAASAKDASPLGLRAEFGPIQFRRLRFKEAP